MDFVYLDDDHKVAVYAYHGNETIPTVSFFDSFKAATEFVETNKRFCKRFELKVVER